jgi:hypothetical protein
MFARIAAVILIFGGVLLAQLASRHARLQAVSETAQANLRTRDADEKLWRLRGVIAQRITPGAVLRLAESTGIGPLTPATNDSGPLLAARRPQPVFPGTPRQPEAESPQKPPRQSARPSRIAQHREDR